MFRPQPSQPLRFASLVDEFGGFYISSKGDAVRLSQNPLRGIYYQIKFQLEVLF